MKIIKYYPRIILDADRTPVLELDTEFNPPIILNVEETPAVELDKPADVNQDESITKDPNISTTSCASTDYSTLCARCRKGIYEYHHDVSLTPMKTDFIRGKNGYSKGIHLWSFRRLKWHHKTNAAIGVAMANAPTCRVGLRKPMIGYDEYSWMWDLDKNKLYHNHKTLHAVQYPRRSERKYRVDSEVWMLLDMDQGTLSFGDRNGHLGVAFHDLNNIRGNLIHPVLTRISGSCHMSMNYIGNLSNGKLFIYLISNAFKLVRDNNLQALYNYNNGNTSDYPKTFLSWILWKYHNHFFIDRILCAGKVFMRICRHYFLGLAN